MTNSAFDGRLYAGNPHVRFDEGDGASAKPRRSSLLYKRTTWLLLSGVMAVASVQGADSVSEGGPFNDAATWGGAMPATGTALYIRGPGEVVFSSGRAEWKANIYVYSAPGGTATFRQTGGFLSTTQDFNIGDGSTYNATGMGYVYISGGTNKLAGAGKAWTVGRRDQGAYAEVSGTGVLDCSVSPLYISPTWGGTSATAEFWLKTGGTFIGTVVNDNASASGAKFVFDGGTFVPSSATPFSGKDRLYVHEGGVVVDTSRQSATIAFGLQANCGSPGGLVKLGGNTLTLSGANSYAGPTIVSNGTLSVAGAASLPNYDRPGSVKVCKGAQLTLGSGWTDEQKAALFAAVEYEQGVSGAMSLPDGGAYDDAATWKAGKVPVAGDTVTIRGPGEVVFSGGTMSKTGNVNVLAEFGRTATFRQTGGYFATSADFNIGDPGIRNMEGTGYVYITGGTNKLTGAGKAWTVGRLENAYAEVSGTGVLDCSVSPMYIAPSWAGGMRYAEFHLRTGGTFIGTVVNNNNGGGGKFVFDGGTFVPTAADPLTGSDQVYVAEGGVVVDTQARDVSISYALQAYVEQPGGLVKLGTGSLTLSGANAYAGPTIVSNGTLAVAGPASLPNYDRPGYVTVCRGATLVVGAGWTEAQKAVLRAAITVEEGGVFGDPLTFDTPTADVVDNASYANPDGGAKTGAYGLTLTGANDFGGIFTVKAGSLAAAFGAGLGSGDNLRLAGGQYAGWSGLVDQALGTGAGQISFVDGTASGFSALTGDTVVRIGGDADRTLVYGDACFNPGVLVLNDARATGVLSVENPLDLNGRELNVRVQSTAHPAVLAGGVRSSSEGGTLKTSSPANCTLGLGATNAFGTLYLDTGRVVMGPGSTNTVSTLRVERGDVAFDGARAEIGHFYNGHLWSSQARTLVVTNDATVAFGSLELNLGAAHQSSGVVDAETLRLGPYQCSVSGSQTYQYVLCGGTLRAKCFYLGEVQSISGNGTGELLQTGGTVEGGYWSTDFIVGYTKGQTSRYYLRGGRFEMPETANDGKQKAVLIANSGRGLLEVSGSGAMSAPYVYLCGWVKDNVDAVGEIRLLTGGCIETRYLATYATGCPGGTVLLDGGTLRLRSFAGSKPLSPGFSYLANLHVGIRGFTLELDDPVAAAQAFTAAPDQTAPAYDRAVWRTAPAFVKRGAGTFTLAGANTYRCATAVEAGTLALAAGATLPEDSVVRVSAGATLDLGSAPVTVKLLAGSGAVRGDVTVADALAADAATLAEGTGLAVDGSVAFGPDAVVDVRGVDERTFNASRRLVAATTPFTAIPELHVNGAPADHTWHLLLRNGDRELVLARSVGTTLFVR